MQTYKTIQSISWTDKRDLKLHSREQFTLKTLWFSIFNGYQEAILSLSLQITPTQFKRFLIDTPLVPVEPKSGTTSEDEQKKATPSTLP